MANQLNLHNVKSVREEYTTLQTLNVATRRIIITDDKGVDFAIVLFGCNGSRRDLQSNPVDQV